MKYLIVGRTSSGKDYLAKKLVQRGLKQVISYTTREKRTPNEDTHIFITKDEAETYPMEDKVARTVIDDAEYFATRQQVNESDIYIIDPRGLDMLVANMPETEFQVIYVKADDDMNRKINAVKRADDKIKAEEKFMSRDADEDEQFSEFEDKIFNRMDSEACFPNNVNTVLIYTNDYSDENVTTYAEKLVNRKKQIEHMTAVVAECLELGLLQKSEKLDINGQPMVRSYVESENGETVPSDDSTQEHCAIRLIGNASDFTYVMEQWLALSKRFD